MAGDLGGFFSIQGGNEAIWEPKVRSWQVTAKSIQVKPSQGQVEVPNVVGLWYTPLYEKDSKHNQTSPIETTILFTNVKADLSFCT